jgi:hypothetical protein
LQQEVAGAAGSSSCAGAQAPGLVQSLPRC